MNIVIIGGGWSGCAAAIAARHQGADVTLIERTDMLLGTGLVGGIMRNNGRYTAAEEMIAMGGGDLFELTDRNTLHHGIEFPGHHHSNLYNVATMEPMVRSRLLAQGVAVHCEVRVTDVEMADGRIRAVLARRAEETLRFEGDVFVDATGTAGGPANCNKYGNGCAMCILRCPSFGGRVSVTAKAGVQEMIGRKGDQVGAMSGSCKLLKESLDPRIVSDLNRTGVAVVPLPPAQVLKGKLALKCCQQYAIPEFEENLVLLDTGHAKLMTPYFPLELLRAVPGFENARYEDPYAGGLGNSIRYIGMAPARRRPEGGGGGQPVLRRRKGRAAGGPHRGHLHGDPGRVQRRPVRARRRAADPAGLARRRRRDRLRATADARGGDPEPQVHLLRVGVFRTDESARELHDRPTTDRGARRPCRSHGSVCGALMRAGGLPGAVHLHNLDEKEALDEHQAKKWIVCLVYVLLLIGLSCPWQKVGEPVYFGFLPAPMFYLILVQLGFVAVLGYLAFFTRLHGRVEDEEDFLRSVKKEVRS